MAPWSSGQDASLSRWNQGFDSPRSHLRSAEYSADLFCRIRDETKSEEYSPGKDILQKY